MKKRNKKLKIAIISPSIWMDERFGKYLIFAPKKLCVKLCDGLVELGHNVVLFSMPNVKTRAKLVASDTFILDKYLKKFKTTNPLKLKDKDHLTFYRIIRELELDILWKLYKISEDFDIIHSFHNASYDGLVFYFSEFSKTPTIFTLHNPINEYQEIGPGYRLRKFKNKYFVSLTNAHRNTSVIPLNFVGTVYNGIEISKYPFNSNPKDYLFFSGRILPKKGPDIAVKIAKNLNLKLFLAGEISDKKFFDTKIKPFLNSKIKYLGLIPLNKLKKYYSNAKALLFPIKWEEPFGLVMIEAMACGTPVIAFDRGSVREIVKDNVTGFIVKTESQMISKIKEIYKIKRIDCRRHIEKNFSIKKMVQEYEKVYYKVLNMI